MDGPDRRDQLGRLRRKCDRDDAMAVSIELYQLRAGRRVPHHHVRLRCRLPKRTLWSMSP